MNPTQAGPRPPNFRLLDALRWIETNYADPRLSLGGVAERLHYSASHLCRLIRAETGAGFRRLLSDIRLEHARQLMLAGNLSIKQVAGSVGYNSTSTFDREFRRRYGCSPTTWRSHCRVDGTPITAAATVTATNAGPRRVGPAQSQ